MESLELNNFLTIKNAKLDVRPFTILIGPQANGKSVIAKLLYFFRNFLNTQFIESVERHDTKRQLLCKGIEYFEQIFPRYTWQDQDFSLAYHSGEISVSLTRKGRSGKKPGLQLEISPNLALAHRKAIVTVKRRLDATKESSDPTSRDIKNYEIYWAALREVIYDAPIGRDFHRSVFIPASRSFFANLQRNVFSFLASNIAIDPLIKEFGSAYESSKRAYARRPLRTRNAEASELRDQIKQEIESILTGRYVYSDEQDWIVSDKRKINLANASSGQQEALPLLIVLKTWTDRYGRVPRPGFLSPTLFIEEPEAHLFPVSQRRLVGIFARLNYAFQFSFVLTTHSPYVLTALNNLIMASNLVTDKGETYRAEIEAIIGKNMMINFDDVSAYTLRNGVLEDILDSDSRLIGSTIIDAVSDEFDRVFDKLMQVELS